MLAELTLSMSCSHSCEWLQIGLTMFVYLTFYKQAGYVGSLSLNHHQENLQHHESEKKLHLITNNFKCFEHHPLTNSQGAGDSYSAQGF